MNITLNRNANPYEEDIAYTATVEIVELTIDTNAVFEVPIHLNGVSNQAVYDVEICGFRAETMEQENIPYMVDTLMSSLVNMARLPSYAFVSRQTGGVYPVYTVGNEVFATTPGGPLFQHVELAKVREYLNDYLHDIGTLGNQEIDDKLHVRGINPHTLGLRRPVFYLKKRVPNETDFWAPVFESGSGGELYTYAANNRHEAAINGGGEIIHLHNVVSEALLADGRLQNIYDLRPDRLLPHYWERLKSTLTFDGVLTINGVELELFRKGEMWIVIEIRENEERYGLFIGKNMEDIRARVAQDFERRDIK